MNVPQTDIANTQSAALALETANAFATDARSAADQTATATQWTLTPTMSIPPYLTPDQSITVRSGPSTLFAAIGVLAKGEKVVLLARSSYGKWFKVKYLNGFGWVFATNTKLSVDPSTLPLDDGR